MPQSLNGAVPQNAQGEVRSLREVAEQAWNDVVEEAPDEAESETVDESGQPRDASGRFVARQPAVEPGEAEPPAPSPEDHAPDGETARPAPEAGRSNEAPQHWSAADRETFSRLDPEGQAFLLRRHAEMERDYTQKAQANATAVQFTQALAPVFQDPVIAGSLAQAKASPFDAIAQWAAYHKRSLDPNPQVRLALWQELGLRMGLNPAAVGHQMSQSGQGQLSEDDLKDPAIRYFADHLGRAFNDMQALRGELQLMRDQDSQRRNADATQASRWTIDQFADERDASGKPKHPHFDLVLPQMIDLFRANPQRNLAQTYEEACWMVPEVRARLLQEQQQTAEQKQATAKARQAVRSNARGITAPVAKPETAPGEGQGLRATLEATADELGI